MQCSEARMFISAYLDKQLDANSSVSVESHLRQCARCREALEELRRVDDRLRSLPKVELGPYFAERLVARLGERAVDAQDHNTQPGTEEDVSGLIGRLRGLFGVTATREANTLDEFSDFFPLSIGSAYFTIMGGRERG